MSGPRATTLCSRLVLLLSALVLNVALCPAMCAAATMYQATAAHDCCADAAQTDQPATPHQSCPCSQHEQSITNQPFSLTVTTDFQAAPVFAVTNYFPHPSYPVIYFAQAPPPTPLARPLYLCQQSLLI